MEGHSRRLVVAVSAAGLTMFACSLGPNQQQAIPLGKDIVIGVPLAATGSLQEEGGMARQGYEMFQSWANSNQGELVVQGQRHRVKLVFEDDQSSPTVDGQLAGGLYGVAIGRLFAGESMFHHERDASKVALVALVDWLRARGATLLDVQWSTPHLASLGVVEVPRARYLELLAEALV